MSAGGMMSGVDGDLLTRVRKFAAGYPELVVSSAFLAAQVGVSAKAVSMVLAPFGVRPSRLSGDVRGYTVAELASCGALRPYGCRFCDWSTPIPDLVDDDAAHELMLRAHAEHETTTHPGQFVYPLLESDEPSALVVLSAGAGHDMTGALRAAGWLP